MSSPITKYLDESPTTTFSAKTREWLNSLNTKSNPNNSSVKNEGKVQSQVSPSFASRAYYNLDSEQKRMPDLLVDQSPMHARKSLWIGGKKKMAILKEINWNLFLKYVFCLK